MEINHRKELHKINYLSSEIDALYHLSSVKFDISDSESIVLYSIYDAGDECSLSDIYKTSGISKQTINSALRNLERKNIVELTKLDGRSKRVSFTRSGKIFAKNTVGKLFAAEADAFEEWSEEEIETYIALMEKYVKSFRTHIEKL